MSTKPVQVHPDRAIAALAGRQHGVVATSQLLELGLTRQSISRRVSTGRLHRLHRGVYAVGHTGISREGRWTAAVFAGGRGAALSHRSAALLWNIWRGGEGLTEVVAPVQRSSRSTVRVHSSRRLATSDTARRRGISVTSVERTIIDLADTLQPHQLANVMHEAAHRRLLSVRRLRAAMRRMIGRAGFAVVRQALRAHLGGSAGTKSRLEDLALRSLRRGGLPQPRINEMVRAGTELFEVDLHWPSARLCVEIDGPGHQRARTQAEDRRRDRSLCAHGYRVMRVTAGELERHPDLVVAAIRRHLA